MQLTSALLSFPSSCSIEEPRPLFFADVLYAPSCRERRDYDVLVAGDHPPLPANVRCRHGRAETSLAVLGEHQPQDFAPAQAVLPSRIKDMVFQL